MKDKQTTHNPKIMNNVEFSMDGKTGHVLV